MTDERNDGLHPRHPGRGKCAVIELESMDGKPEHGGFLIFLPSGATKVVNWRQSGAITPTLEAAQKFVGDVVESILTDHGDNMSHPDIQRVNWTSVCAAVQRVILDWNDKVTGAIKAKMVRDAIEGKTLH